MMLNFALNIFSILKSSLMCIIQGVQHKTILNDLKLELVKIVEPLKMPKKCVENTGNNQYRIDSPRPCFELLNGEVSNGDEETWLFHFTQNSN